jgi:hypothetical protein
MVAEVYELSQQEVPKSGTEDDRNRFGETLAESGKYPGNDPELAATPVNLIAQVLYDHPAARAQHEGHMVYERNGKSVTWVVHNYSTAGTKAHYLSDPFKAVWPKLEERVALRIREKLGESLV